MVGNTDINSHEGEECFHIYLIDAYRPFYNKILFDFSYINISYCRSKMNKTINLVPFLRQIADKIY